MSKRAAGYAPIPTGDSDSKRARISPTDALNGASSRISKTTDDDDDDDSRSEESQHVVYLVMQRYTRPDDTEEKVLGVYSCLKTANRKVMDEFMEYEEAYENRDRKYRSDGTLECSFELEEYDEDELKWWVERHVVIDGSGDGTEGEDLEKRFDEAFDE